MGDEFKSFSLSDFPHLDELLVWHAKQKLPKEFGESQLLRYPLFSKSIQLLPETLPQNMVGEMETAGIVDAIHQVSKKSWAKTKKFNLKFESINVVSEIFHADGS